VKTLPKVAIARDDYERLAGIAGGLLESARGQLPDGTPVWFPDSGATYRGVWLRDFCYMVEGAGSLLPADAILSVVDLFLANQAMDGSVATRVMADGVADFQEGPREDPIGAGPPTDNPSFLAKLLCAYVDITDDWRALKVRIEAVERAIGSLPTDRDGLVVIDPNAPRPGYGFTDCVAKTGKELFSSLLRWEACRRLAETCRRWEMHEEAARWYEVAAFVAKSLGQLFVPSWGMFAAASHDGRQIDVWGSAYACVVGAASGSQHKSVSTWFCDNVDAWHWHGHVRHLPVGEYWQRLLRPMDPEHYQNGGYWAVPTGWVARVVATRNRSLAQTMLRQAISEFEEFGVMEWIHPQTGRHTPGYVASVCNVLGAVIPSKKRRP
jgi:hypothetical protein